MLALRLCLVMGLFVFPAVLLASKEDDVAADIKVLKTSKDGKAKVKALEGIARLGSLDRTFGKPAEVEVAKALGDSDAKVRAAAALTIGKIDPENKKEVVASLSELIKSDKDDKVKAAAAMGLSALGSEAKEALPTLRAAMDKADKKGAMVYKTAIQSINGGKKKE